MFPLSKQPNILEPSCSKLMTSLFNILLKFQMLISEICQYFFLLKRCEKLLLLQKLLSFFRQKISVYLILSRKTLELAS